MFLHACVCDCLCVQACVRVFNHACSPSKASRSSRPLPLWPCSPKSHAATRASKASAIPSKTDSRDRHRPGPAPASPRAETWSPLHL